MRFIGGLPSWATSRGRVTPSLRVSFPSSDFAFLSLSLFSLPFLFLFPLSVPFLVPVTSFLFHFLPSSISSPSPTYPPLSPPFLSSLPFLILSSPLPFFFPLSVSSSFRSHMLHAIALSNFFLAYILRSQAEPRTHCLLVLYFRSADRYLYPCVSVSLPAARILYLYTFFQHHRSPDHVVSFGRALVRRSLCLAGVSLPSQPQPCAPPSPPFRRGSLGWTF